MNPKAWKLTFKAPAGDLQSVALPPELSSSDAVSLHLPGGAYTTLRTFEHSKALHLEDHFRRLEETAALVGTDIQLERERLRQVLRRVMREYPPGQDLRLRLTLDLEVQPGDVYITAEILPIPSPTAYREGVCVVTYPLQRQLPKAKLTRFIVRASPIRQALPAEVNDAILVDTQNHLLEGSSSNFFAIIDGWLWSAEEGVLSGITRSLVLEEAAQAGLPIRLEAANLDDLPRTSEAFITSASRAVLPVVRIDEYVIGSGKPGAVTEMLMERYAQRIRRDIEEI